MKKLSNFKSIMGKNLSHLAGVAMVVVSALVLTFAPMVARAEDYGGGSSGGTGDGGYNTGKCNTGNCYSLWNGAFWLKIPASSDDIDPRSLGFGTVFSGEHITGCKSGGGYAYVLVTRLSQGGLAGMVNIDEAMKRGGVTDGDGGSTVAGSEIVAEAAAHAKFQEHWADFYSQPPYNQNYTGTDLSWFCADPTTTTTTTTTTTPPRYRLNCVPGLAREKHQTWTRIAVKNIALDGYGSWPNSQWKATGVRSSLTTDSWWTGGGASVLTIAKPGDSVQFLHEYCAADRYVRRTAVQGSWTTSGIGGPSHNVIFDIPANRFQIHASPNDTYAFGNGIEWVNSVAASRSEYENLFTDPGANGYAVTPDRYGLGTLSPTPDNNSHNCSSVSQYTALVPYRANASYQIPGYDSGWGGPCAAATSTDGQTNQVGKTISQWHEFNMVKAWEQYTTNRSSGSCGCKNDTAVWHAYMYSPEYWQGYGTWSWEEGYDCELSCNNCCTCDQWDKYDNCTHYADPIYKYTDPSYQWFSQSKSKDYGTARKTATVYTPFNFVTTTTSSLNAGDVIFQGGAIGSSFKWSVEARANDKTTSSSYSPSFPYATVTPSWTKVRMVEFLYAPDAAGGNSKVEGSTTWKDPSTNLNDSQTGPCHYYSGAIQCKEIESISGNQNPEGLYIGNKGGKPYTQTVPDNDEYVGYKYCVAVGFFPSDSHDYKNNTLQRQYSYGRWAFDGSAMDAGDYWNISGASCRTIAKKPNVQVWNGTTYTDSSVNTSITKKYVNKGLGTSYKNNETDIFGSWTEYAIIAGGSTRGMASGAMLGYQKETYNFTGGGQPNEGSSYKLLSPITIANNKSGESGHSNVNASASINTNLSRLRARYSDKAQTFAGGSPSKTIYTAETGMQYAYYDDDVNLSAFTIKSYSDTKNHPNQTTSKNGNGIVKYLSDDGTKDNTLVIYVEGKLTIDGNITLGNTNTPERLGNFASGTSTNSAAKLPQVLIFAKDIDIKENVTRIDAWLIAPEGTINTCSGYKIQDNLAAADAKGRWHGSYGNCYKTLVVSGPVYASNLRLLRTAGGTHGAGQGNTGNVLTKQYAATGEASDQYLGAVAPAEVFNLRADVYLWAYNQAQRYSEAVVTYTRELAPRY